MISKVFLVFRMKAFFVTVRLFIRNFGIYKFYNRTLNKHPMYFEGYRYYPIENTFLLKHFMLVAEGKVKDSIILPCLETLQFLNKHENIKI